MECFSLYLYGFCMTAEHFKTHLAFKVVMNLCLRAKQRAESQLSNL